MNILYIIYGILYTPFCKSYIIYRVLYTTDYVDAAFGP